MLKGDTNVNSTNAQQEEITSNSHSFDIENQIAGDGRPVGVELLGKQGNNSCLWENTMFYIMIKDICKDHPAYVTVHPGLIWNDTMG